MTKIDTRVTFDPSYYYECPVTILTFLYYINFHSQCKNLQYFTILLMLTFWDEKIKYFLVYSVYSTLPSLYLIETYFLSLTLRSRSGFIQSRGRTTLYVGILFVLIV